MKYKLYRYDYEGGYSLGGAESGPGTEWYLTDNDNSVQFVKREGVDDKYWMHTGYPREIVTEYEVQSFHFF